jgi:putative IMPACT (imprinted ancient) family translation regulator
MAEAKATERERIEQSVERAFNRAEDTFSSVYENNRRTVQAMVAYSRNNIEASNRLARDIQDESMRWTQASLDQMMKLVHNNLALVQDFYKRFNDSSERLMKENGNHIEDNINQGMAMMTPPRTRA